ncbi:MAG: DNA recombination protein RmuC [Bacteroidaceae bacterium]|nr:DNA recombination protein RmuC [Bacteroidaceae bacterium]
MMELYYLLFLIIGIALGAIGVYFAMRSQVLAAKERNASTEQQMHDQQDTFREQMKIMQESSQQQMRSQQESQQKQMEQQMALIREQMNSASEKILKERAEELSAVNKEQLSGILTPLQTHIQQMREAVERSDREHNSTMQRLDATIKTSIEQSRQVGERADKLAQALTGENKTQGNFGELRLKQLLEGMGLQEGEQFTLQETIRDKDGYVVYEEEGHRLIPDAILHFPDKRDVIIDSKMSFTAFEDYHNAETEAQRQDALKRHLTSMRNHVNELSRKNYSKYIAEGHAKLDFVLMYVFSESALQLALTNDATLWKDAYDRGVIITGSQNLYTMLRVLEMTWKQVRQVENQQKIMECANMIVDRVQLFAERFESVKQQLLKTQDSFDKLESITAETGQSILTPASRLLKMGASQNPKRKKQLQQEQALENTEEDNAPA